MSQVANHMNLTDQTPNGAIKTLLYLLKHPNQSVIATEAQPIARVLGGDIFIFHPMTDEGSVWGNPFKNSQSLRYSVCKLNEIMYLP